MLDTQATSGNSNTTNVKVKPHFLGNGSFSTLNSNTTNVKVKPLRFCLCWKCKLIQIQPMLRLNMKSAIWPQISVTIQIQPMLRLNYVIT